MSYQNDTEVGTVWRASDDLWNRVAPLLRIDKPRKKAGRPRRDDRVLLEGLVWLCLTGEQWAALPSEFGPKSTCHARFREWIEQGALASAWPHIVADCPELATIDWGRTDELLRAPGGKKGPIVLRRAPAAATLMIPPAAMESREP